MHTLIDIQLIGRTGRAGAMHGPFLDTQIRLAAEAGRTAGAPGGTEQCQKQHHKPSTTAIHSCRVCFLRGVITVTLVEYLSP